ncbi:sn-glycerol 3-phosphate transport system substrate-binding protein [Arthrobacter sp. CAN_A6]|uniref:ABC transporter substrate-binding protein n=1 Tax=Arthrobacter sp. CAN_A6 TaxID=2787721 RepID=UPI0018CBE28F
MNSIPLPPLNRRHFLSFAALGSGTVALAACGGPSTAPPAEAEAADLDFEGVTPAAEIEFWSTHPGQSQDVEKSLIEKFNSSQSDVNVKLVTAGADYEEIAQKFQTAQQGGKLPAVVLLSDVWWFRYYINGSIIPLDGLLDQLEVDKADYRESLMADYQYEDKQWAVPYARSTPLFYYNRDHFKAAGLPDRSPTTWDEFGEWAPKLMSAGIPGLQTAYQFPALAGYAGWSLQNHLWGYGGGWSDEWTMTADSPESVAAIQWCQDAVFKHKWAGVSSTDASADLSSGAVSATVSSTGSLVGVLKVAQFDVGVGFLPGGPESMDRVCPTGGAGLGIPSGVTKEEQLAAAMFLKFMGEPENTAEFSAATGYMPVRSSADMTAVLATSPLIKTAIDQLDVTRPQDYARVFIPGADLEIAKTAAAVLTQPGDVQAEMTKLKGTLESMYQRDVEPNLA